MLFQREAKKQTESETAGEAGRRLIEKGCGECGVFKDTRRESKKANALPKTGLKANAF